MSLTSQFLKKQITGDVFIKGVAGELKKDLAWFEGTPFGQMVINLALGALQAFLIRSGLSETLAVNLIDLIKTEIGLNAPAPASAPAPAASPAPSA